MKNLLPILCLCVLILSCQKRQEAHQEIHRSTPAFEAERNAFFESLVEPAELATQLQATAAAFDPALLNDPKSYGVYANDPVKAAANLGVYMSDLNYCVAYNQRANTQELFTAARELSKVIGVEPDILDFLMRRYRDNIDQNDSVKAVLDRLFRASTTSLKGTVREKMVGIIMSAYQIENLHLALGIIESNPDDIPSDSRTQIVIPIFSMVLDQKKNLEIILRFLNAVSDPTNPEQNPNYAYYVTALSELIEVYTRLDVDEMMAGKQSMELMNDAVVGSFREKVNAIRGKIVGSSY